MKSTKKLTFQRLKKNKIAMIGLAMITFLLFFAVFAPWIAPHDPVEPNLGKRFLSPCKEYPMGTDDLGRCVLSRVIYGARVSLQVSMTVVGIITVIGVTLGLISGYFGGALDELIMRFVDIVLAFPGIILAMAVAGALGPGLFNVMLALALVSWTGFARVVRSSVMAVKEKEFVESARALGCNDLYIMTRHILPNVITPVLVLATLDMGFIILAAASLSFLGLGAQPPIPDWGSMLNNGRVFMRTAPFLTIFPGIAITTAVMAFNFLGDGLRDSLDPRPQRELKK